MEPISFADALAGARKLWGDGPVLDAATVDAAAAGLASQWYRNTAAVEDHAHVEGRWSDPDMLRHNAWATELCRLALVSLVAGGEPEAVLNELLDELIAMLPNKDARESLEEEKGGAPSVAAEWIATNGLGNWVGFLLNDLLYPNHWWGATGFVRIVDQFCALTPAPPDPATFRERLLEAPWELSSEQAEYVCAHRYDVR